MASKQQLTAKIEALKAEKTRLIENCGDTAINQREIYRAQIREIEVQINNLVTERLNADDEETTDAHGNALCERCHSAHIFYADSERYCQSCLLAIESEYDAKIAREEAQSLYNSDSGVDTDDYRAYMDKYAPELVTAATPTPADYAAVEAMGEVAANVFGDEHAFTCTCGAYFVEGTGELCGDCVGNLQAEIRTLESKLAAAVAALERAHKAMEVGKKALWSFADDWNEWEEYTNNTDEPSARYFISNFDDELFMRSLEEAHKAHQVLSLGAQNVKLALEVAKSTR